MHQAATNSSILCTSEISAQAVSYRFPQVMTKHQLPFGDLNNSHCDCSAIPSCQLEWNHNFHEDQTTVLRTNGSDEGLITEIKTRTTHDLIPVEITQLHTDKHPKIKTPNGDFEYVNLNLHFWERTKSDGVRHKMEKYKPNCYYGKTQDTGDENPASSKSADACRGSVPNPVHSVCGIAESSVFFSSIGEWTIVDLNLRDFEKEDAKRTLYLRRKCTPYKEVEPEGFCLIL